ncbi:MAG TPA: cobalamin-dependent protein [Rhodopseudomonas sp.]|uniref:B12-binding domain-containing radical SAM protein n=1 Tax=Rhodopseudomonas sp. TaxID=1078 RepID=UPI002ED7FFAE
MTARLELAPRAADAPPRPDVVLVRPRDFGAVPAGAPVQDPLGVGYLAAGLRADGYAVRILDAHALDLDDDGLVACVVQMNPRLIGLSLHSFADYTHCVAISQGVKAARPELYCVWGGEHATFHAENILTQHAEVDAVVLGEGEATLADLLAALPHAAPAGLAAPVAGVLARGRGTALLHGGFRTAIEDLDAQPEPHKDIVEMALRAGRPVSISVLTGRGCTHRCRFCTAHEFLRLGGGRVWRRRSPRRVVDEIQRLATSYLNSELVHPVMQFQDVIFLGTSTASRRWATEFVEEMERRRLVVPFYCMSRADAIIANRDLLPRLVGVGLWSIEMGIESGVDRILKRYDKQNSSDANTEAIELMRAFGITYDASGFIMFDPSMSLDELRDNALYLRDFGAATWDFFVTRLQLYPGTELRDEMIRKGLFVGADDIGKTCGYRFEDPLVERVAQFTSYYDPSIRDLDLALRDAKAEAAIAHRRGTSGRSEITTGIDLIHGSYCNHLLGLIDAVAAGAPDPQLAALIAGFVQRTKRLAAVMKDILRHPQGAPARAAPLDASMAQ